jgi:hypothetical protein
MFKFLSFLLASTALVPYSYAVETKTWIQNEQVDFEKGTVKNLSVRSDGRLTLAPSFREVFDSAVPYLWALAEDSKGTLYTGGGGPSASTAKLFAIDANGKSRTLAELPGMEIHAIAVDRKDQVYAATAPDAKVYRITAAGKPELFYDPKAKYIWGMAFNSTGDLFIATGDAGEVHRVTPEGNGSVFFRTEETHARSLAIDAHDNVIVGTEPGGLILRISPAGEGFVLYQAGKREVTVVAVGRDGAIYAAAVGSRTSNGGSSAVQLSVPPIPVTPLPGGGQRKETGSTAPAPITTASPASLSGGSEVYRIDPDNFPRKIWSQAQDIVYAISFDSHDKPVLGTGNKGNIYRVENENTSALLINALPTQITGFSRGPKGRLYAVTGNIGKVYQLGPDIEKQGTFESEPLDVGYFSYWGRLSYKLESPGGTVAFETRSGNLDRPQKNWSAWVPLDRTGRVSSPSARFLQYRATLAGSATSGSPELSEVQIAYMGKNVAPVIDEFEITPANYKFPAPSSSTLSSSQSITLPALGARKRTPSLSIDSLSSSSSQSLQYAKGSSGARWATSDANGDELVYRVEIRGAHESEWKLLKDKVKEKYLTWDSTAYPDGEYRLKLIASDAPSNPPEQALKTEIVSDAFLIDNTPPLVIGLTGTRAGQKITARWKARDSLSVVDKAEYSLNGSDWTVVQPTTRLSDAPELDYVLTIDAPAKGEQTFAVRVSDEYDNQSVEKVVIK